MKEIPFFQLPPFYISAIGGASLTPFDGGVLYNPGHDLDLRFDYVIYKFPSEALASTFLMGFTSHPLYDGQDVQAAQHGVYVFTAGDVDVDSDFSVRGYEVSVQ